MPRSQQFAALVAAQPDNELFRFSLAQALLAENQPAAAVEHLVVCANKKADWMMPRILLGKTLLSLGRKAEARPWLEAALAAGHRAGPRGSRAGAAGDIGSPNFSQR